MLGDRRRRRAVTEHAAAFGRYLDTIRDLGPADWQKKRSPDSWSPAEVTQHLILCYEVAMQEMRGDGGEITRRAGPVMSTLLRWFLLPHMFFHRSMPRSRAVGQVRPKSYPADPSRGIERMKELSSNLDAAFLDHPESLRPLRHPYFGRMTPFQFVRLTAVHLDHHRQQIEEICRRPDA